MTPSKPTNVLCVVGARPNFMKIAPVVRALRASAVPFSSRLIHTGQHYDANMKDAFFRQLGIPEPDIDLGVGSGSHSAQTADIMLRFEPVLESETPDIVLVVGDVNSTIACALVAAKKEIPVAHVEAGLRSYDRSMPEEINRVLTDQISSLLFTTERGAHKNLEREGIDPERIHFVGNVMIDTLLYSLDKAVAWDATLRGHGVSAVGIDGFSRGYGVVTMHRPSNVDEPGTLRRLLKTLREVSEDLPLLFPVHPRTEARIRALDPRVFDGAGVTLLPPLGYLEMLGLMRDARVVLTDSGGIQEETTALGVPCVTLRENTERPITVEQGTNTVVGTDSERIHAVVTDILQTGGKAGRVPERWDGKAAIRIQEILSEWLPQTRQNRLAC